MGLARSANAGTQGPAPGESAQSRMHAGCAVETRPRLNSKMAIEKDRQFLWVEPGTRNADDPDLRGGIAWT